MPQVSTSSCDVQLAFCRIVAMTFPYNFVADYVLYSTTNPIPITGLESRLVGKEDPMLARGSEHTLNTGFQIAYGFIAVIDELKSYKEEAMTLFDYR